MAEPIITDQSKKNNKVEITITPESMKITTPTPPTPVSAQPAANTNTGTGSTNDIRTFPTYTPITSDPIPASVREAGTLRGERANIPPAERSFMQGLNTNNSYDATFGIATSKAIVPAAFVEQRPDGSYGLKENARLTLVVNKEYTNLFRFQPQSATITRNEKGQFEINVESKLDPGFLSRLAVANGALKVSGENNAANQGNPQITSGTAALTYNGGVDPNTGKVDPNTRSIEVAVSYKNQKGDNMLQIDASGRYFINPDFRQTVNALIAVSRIGLVIETPKQQNNINNKQQSSLNNSVSGNNTTNNNRQPVQVQRPMMRL